MDDPSAVIGVTCAICVVACVLVWLGIIWWFGVLFLRNARAQSYFKAKNAAMVREDYYREQPHRAPRKWRKANGY